MPAPQGPEAPWLWAGLAAYALAALAAWRAQRPGRAGEGPVLYALAAGVALLAAAIALRWVRTGYGPFLTLFEVLLSNVFSLGLVYLLAYWRIPAVRPGAVVALPVLVLLGAWMLAEPSVPAQLPATYRSPWLWVHVGVGKVFLGALLVAAGLAGLLLLGRTPVGRAVALPEEGTADDLLWRFVAVAFVFHSLMLIAGAVWAQDAWGRYWAWDPLETWAFVTWLALALGLHLRVTWRIPPAGGWALVVGVLALALATFFGVPFLSIGPHKGVI